MRSDSMPKQIASKPFPVITYASNANAAIIRQYLSNFDAPPVPNFSAIKSK